MDDKQKPQSIEFRRIALMSHELKIFETLNTQVLDLYLMAYKKFDDKRVPPIEYSTTTPRF